MQIELENDVDGNIYPVNRTLL